MNIKSLKATRFGRVMARLFGEEKGAVLMEYVVLAVLLVAAVVGAVIVFGDKVRDMFGIGVAGMGGRTKEAQEMQEQSVTDRKTDYEKAVSEGTGTAGGEYGGLDTIK